jgi:hypothetical protein
MYFACWSNFIEEFVSVFCPENKTTTALMRLKSDCYFQGKQNVEAYIDGFKDLVDLSGYTNPISIVLKFRQGLNSMTQDKITESGMDRLGDMDFNGWFKVAQHLDLNCLVNEAFYLASRHPPTHSAPSPMTHFAPPCTLFSLLCSHAPPTAATPVAMHSLCTHFPLAFRWTLTTLRSSNPLHKPAIAVARPVT